MGILTYICIIYTRWPWAVGHSLLSSPAHGDGMATHFSTLVLKSKALIMWLKSWMKIVESKDVLRIKRFLLKNCLQPKTILIASHLKCSASRHVKTAMPFSAAFCLDRPSAPPPPPCTVFDHIFPLLRISNPH